MCGSCVQRWRSAARWVGPAIALALVMSWPCLAAGEPPDAAARPEWSPEAADALSAYRAGQYDLAQRLCARLLTRPGQGPWGGDVEAIDAMCLLRMPGRNDRLAGQARLRQLAHAHPKLLEEPECNLAHGIALTALSETAEAIDLLDLAVSRFERLGLRNRQAEALVALAEAWARHGEWELTRPRFDVRRPRGPDDANALRRGRIEAARSQLEALPNQDEALARLDLVLAEHIIASGDSPGEGLAIYSRLAAAQTLTAPRVEAAMRLAQHYESVEQYAQALRLYERVRHAAPGEAARAAEERAQSLSRPRIVIEVPESAASGTEVPVGLKVRGLDQVQFEVRQVDVEQWLGDLRSRANEALLPESGSIRAAADLDTRTAAPYGWWQPDALDPPLSFTAEPGAYVAMVRGRDTDGRSHTAKRLVVVSDLAALCVVGAEHAVVWATGRPVAADGAAHETMTGRFWMNRSFMPTVVEMKEGVGRFRLPNEARVMRDKGWVCLVRAGEHLAICRGQLPSGGRVDAAPRVALVCGPLEPTVGQVLYVSGILLPGVLGEPELPDDAAVEVSVVDAMEKVLFSGEAPLSPGGAFAMSVPVTAEFGGRHARILARHDGRVLENVAGRPTAIVPPIDEPRFDVSIDTLTWLRDGVSGISGRVAAAFPWGLVPAEGQVHCQFDAVQLPTTESNDWPAPGEPVTWHGGLDERGQMPFSVSPKEFDLWRDPLALTITAHVKSWEGRAGVARKAILLGAACPHVWLVHEPREPVAGQSLRFRVGWFDPGGLPLARIPEIIVRQDRSEIARRRLRLEQGGLTSETWRPTAPGTYELSTALDVFGSDPLQLSKSVLVAARDPSTRPATGQADCRAAIVQQVGSPAARARLEGSLPGPLLVVVEDGDPLAAGPVDRLDGVAEVLLPLESEPCSSPRVVLLAVGADGFRQVAAGPVSPAPREPLELRLSLAEDEIWPATTVTVRVACQPRSAASATLMARLVDAARPGFALEFAEPLIEAAAARGPELAVVSSLGPALVLSARGRAEEELASLLSAGQTLWTTCVDADADPTELRVPIPEEAGLYALIVTAREPSGELVHETLILDARRGVRVTVDTARRMTLGDRSRLSILVENRSLEPVDADIDWNAGEGLRASPAGVFLDGERLASTGAGPPARLTIPAGKRAWLRAEVTAVEPGAGQARVDVLVAGRRRTAECDYEVAAPGATSEDAGIRVARTLWAWTEVISATTGEDGHLVDGADWDWLPVTAQTRLLPGRLLRVREEFTLSEPQPPLRWSQRCPPTCLTATESFTPADTIGRRQPSPPGELSFEVSRLGVGPHVQEYWLAVVRPGVCILPAPELQRDAERVPVVVTPTELRLSVDDPPGSR